MIEVKGLSKKYNKELAVENLDLFVDKGEIAVLVGPNGAGKSTTIKAIAGLLNYEGEILLDSCDNKGVEAKSLLGYIPEMPSPFPLLTIEEHLHYIAKAYGIKDYKDYMEELLKLFNLDDKRDKLGGELSKGMQQKLSICCAILHKPKIILFDEPMIGLDPMAIKEVKRMMKELRDQGASLLVSTHLLDSMEDLWDRILIMKKGKVIFSKSRNELSEGEKLEEIFFEVMEE
ncbi:ABC transporter ATP-binding protein [Clostridium sp. MSJ-4]|uniref:ABC transporter ATP-binding protein n=1 Tax=Clostridium simiarum TaxID=2841506 RepID=A0ABS6F578_9CLOT|nr:MULTISPECIES: ABC transporter ATP-binding protein [Clostridium]MBU5593456.1 ABC transporter ATP-binding protein [Clostridium simiarum]